MSDLEWKIMSNLKWKKYHPLSDQNAFICLVDVMGDDSSIVQAARVSYGKDEQTENTQCNKKDRQLIRYLMNHSHTTPFEMVEFKFMVQVPMDCWRQWIRHRTANVNEYSTRYTEALDFFQVTQPTEWRLQATDNKQGSSGYLEEWPEGPYKVDHGDGTGTVFEPFDREGHQNPGSYLSTQENELQYTLLRIYQKRLALGVAKEQARKDLPLSTYTRAYWKCDLHNIFNFLRLRLDSHAQLEIRSFANSMLEIVKQVCPLACEAFVDYVLEARRFSAMEMKILHELIHYRRILQEPSLFNELEYRYEEILNGDVIYSPMTDREWADFLKKLS